MKRRNSTNWLRTSLTAGVLGLAAVGSTGCQITESGQTLPSPYYLHDDVQFFPRGAEFKLQNEANALKAASARRPTGP